MKPEPNESAGTSGRRWAPSALARHVRLRIIAAVALTGLLFATGLPPFPQDPAYHDFADQRRWLGVAHFANVISNLAILAAGLAGLSVLRGRWGQGLFITRLESWPYVVFFAGVVLVSFGSTYYHQNPTSETLYWDRLPMTLAFMALLAGFVADRIHARIGVAVVLPILLVAGVASVTYWRLGDAAGVGDLRFYYLVQVLAMLLIPLVAVLFAGRVTSGRYVLYMALCYGIALVGEFWDHWIYAALGQTVSGHTLKHLAAAAAIAMIALMLRKAPFSRKS